MNLKTKEDIFRLFLLLNGIAIGMAIGVLI